MKSYWENSIFKQPRKPKYPRVEKYIKTLKKLKPRGKLELYEQGVYDTLDIVIKLLKLDDH